MKFKLLTTILIALAFTGVQAQDYYGATINRAKNVHAGNKIRVTFHNNARLGSVKGDNSVTYTGEWPIGTGKVQMGNTSPYVISQLRFFKEINTITGDTVYDFITPTIFCEGWDPALFSHDSLGVFWGFEPVNGYLNVSQKEKDPFHAVSMSHQPFTWPAFWPDKMDDANDPGWASHWNGYFGKDQKNSDEESYFVLDDYAFQKKIGGHRIPRPIPELPSRGGLGLQMEVRGLQWSNPDAEDVIFWLYGIQNIGSLKLDKTLFGINVGASSGNLLNGGGSDNSDDAARFYREKALAVNYDLDNIGVGGYTPVPWVGFAFLESPGNPFDGIDNDGDGNNLEIPGGGTGKVITENDFTQFYAVGAPVVTIDYNDPSYPRTVSTMPAGGLKISHNGINLILQPNAPLTEISRNGIDDNLNGLIDESDGARIKNPKAGGPDSVSYYLYIKSEYNDRDYLAIDYITGTGKENLMIDERRDDGKDNDGDWDPSFDDVGLDGKPGTGDEGEGDGLPTGAKGNLPGEPNIDKVDVDESDQIGLTNFKFYIYGTLTYSNDEQMWGYSRPGYFDNSTVGQADYDYVFSSGFFPLQPGKREFFSIAMVYGADEQDILRNKEIVQKIYNSNYNFAIAPNKPKLSAVAGDRKVTLYWDDGAEYSFDRFLRDHDFEGYKIYKSTHYTFGDAGTITDGLGYERFKKPIAIYDKIDSVFGFFPKDFGSGVLFNLGNETGLVHTYVDEDVINGIKYFYAVTAFDRGNLRKNIGPSECTIFLNVEPSGKIQFAENVLAITPQAPSGGFEAAGFDIVPKMVGEGRTYGSVGVNILNADSMITGDVYELQFLDQSMDSIDNDHDGILDQADADEKLPIKTTGFTLRNLTRDERQDTVRIDTVSIETYRSIKTENGALDSLVQIYNLYDDRDGNPRTFSKVMQGMEIVVNNPLDSLYTNLDENIINGIKWSNNINPSDAYDLVFGPYSQGGFRDGMWYPRQYMIVFYDSLAGTSTRAKIPKLAGLPATLPAIDVNYKVFDLNRIDPITQKLAEVPFIAFDNTKVQAIKPGKGVYSASDRIIMFEQVNADSIAITMQVFNPEVEDTNFYRAHGDKFLGAGDTLRLFVVNPFTANTKYTWTVRGEAINNKNAKSELDRIKVVPNPYVVTALWEPFNPYSAGRGPRLVQFINLPQVCKIRIYTVDGTLVKTLDHSSTMSNGSEPWDLMTKDNMDVAYGLYIYHVDAPGLGEHVGRMLLIK